MIADRLGYKPVGVGTVVIKDRAGPAGLFSVTCTGAGNITIYDNPSAGSGTVLFTITGATAGQIFHWGGTGIGANTGLTAVSTGSFIVAFT